MIQNQAIKEARKVNIPYVAQEFENGDTPKQLLIRSRYLLCMDSDKWTENQKTRAKIIFREYPAIKQAYNLTQGLRNIYNTTTVKEIAYTKLAHWYNKIENWTC